MISIGDIFVTSETEYRWSKTDSEMFKRNGTQPDWGESYLQSLNCSQGDVWSMDSSSPSAVVIICIACTCRSSVMGVDPTSMHCADLKTLKQVSPHGGKYILLYFCFHCTSLFLRLYCLKGEKENIKCLILGKREKLREIFHFITSIQIWFFVDK